MEPGVLTARLGVLVALTGGLFWGGCDLARFGVDQSATVLERAAPAFYREPDIEFAREGLAANVKLVEGLLESSPENRSLLVRAAEGVCGYAFLFIEDDREARPPADDLRRAAIGARASRFYGRCRAFAERALEVTHPNAGLALQGPLPELEVLLSRCQREDVPALFWLAFAMASYANLNRDDVAAIADLPRIEALLWRVVELDEQYFHASARMALGTLLAARPRILGGNPEKGRDEIERAIALTGGRFLMHKLMLARVYAVTTGNRKLFEEILEHVVATPGAIDPSQRLMNEIARGRARRYLAIADELF